MNHDELEYWLLMLEMYIIYEETGMESYAVFPVGAVRETFYVRCGEFNALCRQCLTRGAQWPCGVLKPIGIYRELPSSPAYIVTEKPGDNDWHPHGHGPIPGTI